eukprot:2100518-Ditylum_brightwellii.AAC.1
MLPHDFQELKMFIPLYDYVGFKGRCVVLKGQSRLFWLHNQQIFQYVVAAGTHNIDDATKKAINCDAIGINESEERKWSYCLFIWLVGTCLDNNIFSTNSELVKSEVHPLKLSADHKHNPFVKDMNAYAII